MALVLDRKIALHRRGRDDHARGGDVEEMLDRRLGAEEGTAQVHPHHPVELGGRGLVRLVDDLDPGIVDEDVEAAEGLDGAGEKRIDRVLVGDVGGGEEVLAPGIGSRQFLDAAARPARDRR